MGLIGKDGLYSRRVFEEECVFLEE